MRPWRVENVLDQYLLASSQNHRKIQYEPSGSVHFHPTTMAHPIPKRHASLSAMTALREVAQVGNLQPTTLISYEADIDRVFDCRDEHALKAQDMDAAALADCTWRDQMKARGEARTQAFARRLIAAGYHALLVRSFAPGATEDDMNLVLWTWSDAAPARLILIDDENRLSRRSLSMMPTPSVER